MPVISIPMRIITRNSYETVCAGPSADGAVFCDVFRASTTLITILSRRPARVVLTNDEQTAKRLVAAGAVLFSEVFSGGFDNSPSQARLADIIGKTVVHKSTNMTNAIFQHAGFKRGFIGGFVNIRALVGYLKVQGFATLEIVAASHFERKTEAVEDVSCVQLISRRFRDETDKSIPMLSEIKSKIEQKRSRGGYSAHYFTDVELAMNIDEFDFLAEIKMIDANSMELFRVDLEK